MIANDHQKLADFIWSIANKLRGPYRPPQYRKVMLPLIVLRRLDCVLEATKDEVLKKYAALKNKGLSQTAIEKALAKTASKDRDQPLYNISRYTFQKLLGDPDGLARNLTAYIKGFSPKVREIFERFEFEAEIEKLDGANRLFEIIKEFSAIDLHPENASNIEMGYVFENLIRRFNEQANEEAGDHFTPRILEPSPPSSGAGLRLANMVSKKSKAPSLMRGSPGPKRPLKPNCLCSFSTTAS